MQFDTLIMGGTIYDGSGGEPYIADIGLRSGIIVDIGNLKYADAGLKIDARDLAVAPGFINMLSHATRALLHDGLSEGNICQGVTLEVIGEGVSMGPLNDRMAKEMADEQTDIKFTINWRSLGEFLNRLQLKGISTNVASFVGATTVREYVLGQEDRKPNERELSMMRNLVSLAMSEGAVGLSSALIYAPACFADTDELVCLAEEAAKRGGIYASHLRSEGDHLLEGVRELISICQRARIPGEIYHLKAAGKRNWSKMDEVIAELEKARAAGHRVSADMYLYTRAHTGLDAAMPTWVQEGGLNQWIKRLQDPAIRSRVKEEMLADSTGWENGYMHAGPEGILLVGFKSEALKPLTGKTLKQIADERGQHPADVAMDLVVEDGSRVDTVYSWMSEENIVKQVKLPWVTFGSDGSSMSPSGEYLKSQTHPRAYGNFTRLLEKYVRTEKIISLPEAIRRLTALPAANLGLLFRGKLDQGYAADIVIFDPDRVHENATFENGHQLSEGVLHVLVNGVPVLQNGRHTGNKPGMVLRRRMSHRMIC
ncbi:MAG: amidohydrolase family protein [Candidatus Obscuribacterales bacterium]|nr:amidohydrolase family protein [Candidatus Obscuribacterales bacterium]